MLLKVVLLQVEVIDELLLVGFEETNLFRLNLVMLSLLLDGLRMNIKVVLLRAVSVELLLQLVVFMLGL